MEKLQFGVKNTEKSMKIREKRDYFKSNYLNLRPNSAFLSLYRTRITELLSDKCDSREICAEMQNI